MRISSAISTLAALSTFLHYTAAASPQAITKVLHQFPTPSWLENIAVTHSGHLLLNRIAPAELHLLDPSTPNTTTLIHSFSPTGALLGISELQDDVFAVVYQGFDVFNSSLNTPASGAVWKVDLRGTAWCANARGNASAVISKIADMPTAELLNGMTTLDSRTLLVADSFAGVVWKLDASTGEYFAAIDDSSMAGVAGQAPGINGVKYVDGFLYYDNDAAGTFYRVRISPTTGQAIAKPELLASNLTAPDDFAVRVGGVAYLAGGNAITKVDGKGAPEVVVGGGLSRVVAGSAGAAFGRTARDWDTLYVVGAGMVNETVVEGAKVVAVKL